MSEIIGLSQLNATIRSLVENIENDVKDVIAENAYLLESKSKDITPVDTGRLRSSIGTELNGLKAKVSVGANYAKFVEFGTRYQKDQPFFFNTWAWVKPKLIADLKRAIKGVGD
jgi:HK97 gp10 family phage protein